MGPTKQRKKHSGDLGGATDVRRPRRKLKEDLHSSITTQPPTVQYTQISWTFLKDQST
jgi:hypothetical protein